MLLQLVHRVVVYVLLVILLLLLELLLVPSVQLELLLQREDRAAAIPVLLDTLNLFKVLLLVSLVILATLQIRKACCSVSNATLVLIPMQLLRQPVFHVL